MHSMCYIAVPVAHYSMCCMLAGERNGGIQPGPCHPDTSQWQTCSFHVWIWFACTDTAPSACLGCLKSTDGKSKFQHVCISAGSIMATLVYFGLYRA